MKANQYCYISQMYKYFSECPECYEMSTKLWQTFMIWTLQEKLVQSQLANAYCWLWLSYMIWGEGCGQNDRHCDLLYCDPLLILCCWPHTMWQPKYWIPDWQKIHQDLFGSWILYSKVFIYSTYVLSEGKTTYTNFIFLGYLMVFVL